VVYEHECTAALPIAMFVHEEEAQAYVKDRPGPAVKMQLRTIERRSDVLTVRGGGLTVGTPAQSPDGEGM
jgi:hypothetical protein